VIDKINAITDHLSLPAPMVIWRLRNRTAIDATGIAELEELADQSQKSGRSMLLCGARSQAEALMREAGFDRHVASENICENITEALKRADEIYNTRISAPAAAWIPDHLRSDCETSFRLRRVSTPRELKNSRFPATSAVFCPL
jgi:ABC-type transporter Mla MlaB component